MKKIILEIKTNGDVIMEAQGMKGPVCTKETSWLEKLLGRVTSRTLKKDYHEHEYVKVR